MPIQNAAIRKQIVDNRLWILDKLKKRADVACGTCTACCRSGHKVFLYEAAGDLPLVYAKKTIEYDPYWGDYMPVLERREDGSCAYLGETGCTIHDMRPASCRAWSCIDQFRLFKPDDVKLLKRRGQWKPEHAEGERRAKLEDAAKIAGP